MKNINNAAPNVLIFHFPYSKLNKNKKQLSLLVKLASFSQNSHFTNDENEGKKKGGNPSSGLKKKKKKGFYSHYSCIFQTTFLLGSDLRLFWSCRKEPSKSFHFLWSWFLSMPTCSIQPWMVSPCSALQFLVCDQVSFFFFFPIMFCLGLWE